VPWFPRPESPKLSSVCTGGLAGVVAGVSVGAGAGEVFGEGKRESSSCCDVDGMKKVDGVSFDGASFGGNSACEASVCESSVPRASVSNVRLKASAAEPVHLVLVSRLAILPSRQICCLVLLGYERIEVSLAPSWPG
jgi:hypothetical protein